MPAVAIAAPMLLWVGWSDWRTRVLPACPMALLWAHGLAVNFTWQATGIAALVTTLGLILATIAPKLVAGGDAKLAGALSLLVGPSLAVPLLMGAAVAAGVGSLTLHRRGSVPLGTYLCGSAAVALLGGLAWMNYSVGMG